MSMVGQLNYKITYSSDLSWKVLGICAAPTSRPWIHILPIKMEVTIRSFHITTLLEAIVIAIVQKLCREDEVGFVGKFCWKD